MLDPDEELRFSSKPKELLERINGIRSEIKWIIIDEVQKVPKLLDVVHSVIGKTALHFVLTVSSARKLKRGAADLLAGRAFVYNLYPFSALELGKSFNLIDALN